MVRRHETEIEEAGTQERDRPESAWLIHFKRETPKNRLPLHGSAIRRMESEANQIARSLAAMPDRLKLLRGIDVCGVEEAQPLWVSAETLRRVRAKSSEIAGARTGLDPLRLTVHAGEDFRWLTSGMRAIAEPFHWKLLERGDRIGHGIAVTLEPLDWWQRHEGQVIPVRRFDRLLDLAFLATYGGDLNTGQQEWLLREIGKTVQDLRLERLERAETPPAEFVETARKVWLTLGSPLTRRLLYAREWKGDANRRHEKWIHSYLWRRSIQNYAAETILMKVDDDQRIELELLAKARRRLIHEIARLQVCIESNPSSNMLVGSLDAPFAQDFLQQRPTRAVGFGEETLTWTISTDDPITFSTTLADEFAYAWAGMVLRDTNPYDPSYARALLDEAAATSMRMRFTVPRHDRDRAER